MKKSLPVQYRHFVSKYFLSTVGWIHRHRTHRYGGLTVYNQDRRGHLCCSQWERYLNNDIFLLTLFVHIGNQNVIKYFSGPEVLKKKKSIYK